MTAQTHVTITRVLQAPIERVFAAWTDPALMACWFYPVPTWTAEVENDLVVGGRYTVRMYTGEPEPTVMTGVYQSVEPPVRLVFTWNSHAINDTLVTIDLRDVGGATELTLTHERLVEAATRDLTTSGWTGCLDSLERYLALA
jgi:uncharacterized protein YndB with AHSA1/START domain